MKKGGLFKKIIIAVVALVILGMVFGGGGNSSKPSGSDKGGAKQEQAETQDQEQAESESEEKEPEAPVQSIYHVGDALDDGGLEIVYMASGEHVEDNQFLQPKDGNKYVFLELAFINTSKSDKSISMYSFDGYADGYAVEMYYGGDEDLSATLSPGRSTSGYLYFEVPVDAQEIEIEYTPNVFLSDKITFAFDGEADSGYVLEANTSRSDGALSVGESVQGSNVTITYLSSGTWESDNMFVVPRDGYHFVSVELEFENTGSSDKSVSSFSFDCYADGISCEQSFYRDDDLSATISAGRKAKGTVTFEVPDNASVIEVEYVDNVWTSDRIVFTVQ